jgi:hypothetical protein
MQPLKSDDVDGNMVPWTLRVCACMCYSLAQISPCQHDDVMFAPPTGCKHNIFIGFNIDLLCDQWSI